MKVFGPSLQLPRCPDLVQVGMKWELRPKLRPWRLPRFTSRRPGCHVVKKQAGDAGRFGELVPCYAEVFDHLAVFAGEEKILGLFSSAQFGEKHAHSSARA